MKDRTQSKKIRKKKKIPRKQRLFMKEKDNTSKVLIHATTWINLKIVCQMKEARHKRPCSIGIHLYEMSSMGKFIETESRLVVARGWDGDVITIFT